MAKVRLRGRLFEIMGSLIGTEDLFQLDRLCVIKPLLYPLESGFLPEKDAG